MKYGDVASTRLRFAVILCPISWRPSTVMMAAEKIAPLRIGLNPLSAKLKYPVRNVVAIVARNNPQ